MRPRPRMVGLMIVVAIASGCGWHGPNSLPLPGTEGHGAGSYEVKAELPDVSTLQQNSRVRVGDVTVGTVTRIERRGWHALVAMTINGGTQLPANAVATIGQTSLLGSPHIELGSPPDVAAQGSLRNGSVIPLSRGDAYPTTEQTLAAASLLLNGGGLGQVQDITKAFSTAFAGREDDLRSLIGQLDQFMAHLNNQTNDIIAATQDFNGLVGQFAEQKPVLDRALRAIPDAIAVLAERRDNLSEALDKLGRFSAVAARVVNNTKEPLIAELKDIDAVLNSLANAGPALTRSLSLLSTFPWAKETLSKWMRGDYANLTMIVDMTLSRLDQSFFTGTRWAGDLTELEMQWGRTIGQLPSPYTSGNPLIVPYQHDQGP